jgi:hypothetical protein
VCRQLFFEIEPMKTRLLFELAKVRKDMGFSLRSGSSKSNAEMSLFNSGAVALLFVVVNLFAFNDAFAQTNTWDGSSGANWNTAANWSLNAVPTAAHDVIIPNGITLNITINTAAFCNNFTINGGGTDNTVSISAGNSLTVTNAVTIGAGTGNDDDKFLAVGTGTLSCASISVAATGAANRDSGVTLSTGTVNVTGSITMGNVNDDFTFTGAGTLNIGNTMTGGTFTASTGTVNYYNAAQTVGTYIYNNLTLSGSGVKTTTGVTVNGILSMEGTATASAAISYGGAATLRYNTATNRTVSDNEWPATFTGTGGVIIANTSTITLNGNKQLGNNSNVPLNINAGATLSTSGSNFGLTFHGDLINNGTLTAGSSAITIAGTTNPQSIAGFTTTGTVSLTKTGGTATLTGNVNGDGLSINGIGGTLNLGTGLTHTFTGDWTRTNGTLDGGASTLIVGGNASGAGGAFTASTSTVEWNAAGAQTLAGVNYNNLALSGSGVKTLQAGTTTIGGDLALNGTAATTAVAGLSVGGSVTLGSGTIFTAGAFSHNVGGDWTNNGATFNNTGGTINLDGAAQNIGGTSSTTFNNLTLAGSNTKTFNVATFTTSTFTVSSGAVANLGTFTNHTANLLYFGGAGQAAGTWGGTTSAAANINSTFFAAATGILTVAAQGPTTYYSRQTGNWNTNTTWSTVTYGNATNDGTFPIAGDAVNIGGGDFTITVNVNSACASLNYQGGATNSPTVSIGGTNTLNVSGAIDLSSSGGFGGDANTLAVGGGTLNAGTLGFSTGGAFGDHELTISSGTATISGDVTGGSLLAPAEITFSGAGVLNIGGDCTLNSLISTLTPSTGTVHFFGTVDQSVPDLDYYNLQFSGAGNKTPVAAMNIDGNLTLAAGTSFTSAGYTHTLAGNWINNGATINSSNSTISLDGAAQNIGGTTPTTFNNLTLAGTNTKTFALSTTMDGLLTINTSVVANLSSITTHTSRALTLGTSGQGPGTFGSTASAATNQDDIFFTAASTGILTVTGRAFYSRAGGDWNTAATWSNSTYGGAAGTLTPGAADVVNIGGGNYAITVGANSFCASLSYQPNTTNDPTLTINSGTLTVSGAINIPSGGGFFGAGVNTLAVGAGSLVAGSMEFSTGGLLGGHRLTISSGTATINGDVTQGFPNATITFTGAGQLRLGGAFLNSTNCDFTASTGTVHYLGSVAQTIGDFTYYNLTLNNTSGSVPQLTLFDDATVSNILTMTSGVVNLNGNTLSLTNTAAAALNHSLASSAGWMYGGTFRRTLASIGAAGTITVGTVAGLFPLGTSGDWRPFFIGKANGANTGGVLNVSHDGTDNGTSPVNFPDDIGTVVLRSNAFWTVAKGSGFSAGNYDIRAGGTGFGVVGAVDDLRLTQTGSETGTSSLPNSGDTTTPLVNKTGVTNAIVAQNYYIGSVDATNSPLPISLLYFNAKVDGGRVITTWSTAQELNNDFFTIERATNIEQFEVIGEPIEGAGTTKERRDYSMVDENPLYGRSYYRLKQTDFDGKFTYSNVQLIDYEGPRFATLKVYPNPSKGDNLTVVIAGLKEQTSFPIHIYNIQGQLIYKGVFEVDNPGTIHRELEFGNQLRSGVYIIRAGETLQLTQKFFVD